MIGILARTGPVVRLIIWLYERVTCPYLAWGLSVIDCLIFLFSFLITATCSLLGFLLNMLIAKYHYQLNPQLSFVNSRGYLVCYQICIIWRTDFSGCIVVYSDKKFGFNVGIVISSLAFGIYHWFSHELWGHRYKCCLNCFLLLLLARWWHGAMQIPVNVYTNNHSLLAGTWCDGGDLFGNTIGEGSFCGNAAKGHRFLIQLPYAIAVAIDHLCITKQLILRRYKQILGWVMRITIPITCFISHKLYPSFWFLLFLAGLCNACCRLVLSCYCVCTVISIKPPLPLMAFALNWR